mgnify:FL=1
MMEADFKAIWNLPFLCPYLNHRIFHLPYYSDFHGAAKSFSP